MKKILIAFIISFLYNVPLKAQPIIATDFSYINVGNDYTFYLSSYFSFGSGTGPKVKWVLTELSNDTIFIKAIYDHRGKWAAMGSSSFDSAKFTNTNSGINYFNVSSNYIDYYLDEFHTDTTWNAHDSTFYVGKTAIEEKSFVKDLLIYPNPTNAAIHLPITASRLKVYNVFGQIILDMNNLAPQSLIDVTELNSGLYFVEVYDKEKNKVGVGKFYKE